MGVSTGQNFIQWMASLPLSLLLNNQFYPLASCPLDKELSSGQPYPVDNLSSILNNRALVYY